MLIMDAKTLLKNNQSFKTKDCKTYFSVYVKQMLWVLPTVSAAVIVVSTAVNGHAWEILGPTIP